MTRRIESMGYTHRITQIIVVVLILLFLNIPFETVAIPEWKIRVVNELGLPMPGITIRQHWNNYSFDLSATDGKEEDKVTDSNGNVTFLARKDRESLLFRSIAFVLDILKIGIIHSSSGVHATILSPDHPDSSLSYDGSGSLPDTLVIRN